ncbi:MAG TPA: FGGY family carbohydrate kinase [Chitinophagaceae bacterium]|nr:FGGY family carbohydrate kinase [Chitinophagaceae bacterium]
MLTLGLDIGTSSVKAAVLDGQGNCLAAVTYPGSEAPVLAVQPGWAEQDPGDWWEYTVTAIRKLHATGSYDPAGIVAIGIAYQMHGLVIVDKMQDILRPSIIWCDSRATDPVLYPMGNFTAGKLEWVRKNEPQVYERIHKFMLPGDFIAMKLTGRITTTRSALSEGNFIDLSTGAINYYDFDPQLFPDVQEVFSGHGKIKADIAAQLGLSNEAVVAYKAGDQLNNAFALNVMEEGEVAATAGTSGVVYAITNKPQTDSFIHVNEKIAQLLCINGCGSMNAWIKRQTTAVSYEEMNRQAAAADSDGLYVLPFGNGAERMFDNKLLQAHIAGIDLNKHTTAHLYRAVQEGIAFAFRYGIEVYNMTPTVIRAGHANLFLSELFRQAFVNTVNVPVELYGADGAVGAALGAAKGLGTEITRKKPGQIIEPTSTTIYEQKYQAWKDRLRRTL